MNAHVEITVRAVCEPLAIEQVNADRPLGSVTTAFSRKSRRVQQIGHLLPHARRDVVDDHPELLRGQRKC